MRAAPALFVACFSVSFASVTYAQSPSTASQQSVLVAPASAVGRDLAHQDVELWLDGFLPYALQRGDVAGAVVVIVKEG